MREWSCEGLSKLRGALSSGFTLQELEQTNDLAIFSANQSHKTAPIKAQIKSEANLLAAKSTTKSIIYKQNERNNQKAKVILKLELYEICIMTVKTCGEELKRLN